MYKFIHPAIGDKIERDKKMSEQFYTRLTSFLWRFASYIIAIGLAWLANNIGLLELNPFYTTLLGLIFGELSKAWSNRQALKGKTFLGFNK